MKWGGARKSNTMQINTVFTSGVSVHLAVRGGVEAGSRTCSKQVGNHRKSQRRKPKVVFISVWSIA